MLTSHKLILNPESGLYTIQVIETKSGDDPTKGVISEVVRELKDLDRNIARRLMATMGIEEVEFDVADMALLEGEDSVASFGWFGGFVSTDKE